MVCAPSQTQSNDPIMAGISRDRRLPNQLRARTQQMAAAPTGAFLGSNRSIRSQGGGGGWMDTIMDACIPQRPVQAQSNLSISSILDASLYDPSNSNPSTQLTPTDPSIHASI
jgi:hypothetical protein